jgi:hypothetical protein
MAKLLSVALGFLSQPLNHLSQLSFLADPVWINNGQVITSELSNSIQETLDIWNITGLSVAVVPRYGEPEFHSWGNRTEDGDKTTEDVRTAQISSCMNSEAAISRHCSTWRLYPRLSARALLGF